MTESYKPPRSPRSTRSIEEETPEDPDRTVTRLLSEIRAMRKIIDEIQQAFRNSPALDGLSLTGAALAVLKRNNELEAEVKRLDREIDRMIKKDK